MKFLRVFESLLKKINRLKNNTKNKNLKRAFLSAEYNTLINQEYIFSNDKISYVLKNNEEISKRIFIDGEFDYKIIKKALSYLKKKRKYLVNVGAHVGTTLIPAIKNNLFSNYVAFEPSSDNFRLLTANINLNKIEKKGEIYNLALSRRISKSYLMKFEKTPKNDVF